jgi:hypothetical protein
MRIVSFLINGLYCALTISFKWVTLRLLSPLPENPSFLKLGMKAARSGAEAASLLLEPDNGL